MMKLLNVLTFGKMSRSTRGKFMEYVCADPRTQKMALPRQQCLPVHREWQGLPVSSSLDFVSLGAGTLVGRGLRSSWLS